MRLLRAVLGTARALWWGIWADKQYDYGVIYDNDPLDDLSEYEVFPDLGDKS